MRAKTRMEPFRSSMVLWSFFLRISAGARSFSATPIFVASTMAWFSAFFALRTESISAMLHDIVSCNTWFTLASHLSFSNSFLSAERACRSRGSLSSSPAASAAATAACKASLVLTSRASDKRCLAKCLGSSTLRIFSASAMAAASTPTSRACWIVNLRCGTSLLSMAASSAACAFSFDSAPANSSRYSESSSSLSFATSPALSAFFSCCVSPLSFAASRASLARCRGSSSASTFFAAASSESVKPIFSASAIANLSPPTSRSFVALRRASLTEYRSLRPWSFSLASVNFSSDTPSATATLIAASSSPGEPSLSTTALRRWRARTFRSTSSVGISSTLTSLPPSSAPRASSIMVVAKAFFLAFAFGFLAPPVAVLPPSPSFDETRRLAFALGLTGVLLPVATASGSAALGSRETRFLVTRFFGVAEAEVVGDAEGLASGLPCMLAASSGASLGGAAEDDSGRETSPRLGAPVEAETEVDTDVLACGGTQS
mmetsp:Transcript_22551/g.49479  ORF Transcript_22551/g.49479 Transcript_22551/m.49479 type:complete len:490 (-) Transcript_22551:1260-2729(-)